MAVGFKVGYYWFQVGTSDFLHSFFSTICIRLEHGKWGRVYPKLMGELYQGCLKNQDLNEGLEELRKGGFWTARISTGKKVQRIM